MAIVGGLAATLIVELAADPAEKFPAASLAAPEAIEMPRVPVPVNEDRVTVQPDALHPETVFVALAFPVAFKTTSVLVNVVALAPVYETVYVMDDDAMADDREGPLKETVGAVLSTVINALGPAASVWFPALSRAVFAATDMPTVPLPVRFVRVTVQEGAEQLAIFMTATVPVVLTVISDINNEMISAPVYVIV